MVLSANHQCELRSRDAIEHLCQRYWLPLFAFVRRRGYLESEAEDLVQAFFLRVIEKGVFASANPDRGRFRTFLLSSLENFLANEHAKSEAVRRGGGRRIVSLQLRDDQGHLIHQIADAGRPEDEFHRQWAIAVLRQVLETIEQEYANEGKSQWFNAFRPYLSSDSNHQPYAAVAQSLGISVANAKVAVHRLRRGHRPDARGRERSGAHVLTGPPHR